MEATKLTQICAAIESLDCAGSGRDNTASLQCAFAILRALVALRVAIDEYEEQVNRWIEMEGEKPATS